MLRIATIGTSMITDNFIEALHANDQAVFVGTLSRDADRAASFTAAHGGTRPFTQLEDLAQSDEVDAVYIGSPNALHAPQAQVLIAGGKHVLAEKSFASNAREAQAVFDAGTARGVVVMEAMRSLHNPAFDIIRAKVRELGRVRRATLRFGRYSSRYDELLAGRATSIFDCAMASGSLMDIGIYAIEPMIALFGAPASLAAAAVLFDEGTRDLTHGPLDGAGSVLARYPDKVVELAYSKITNDNLPSQVESEQATFTIDSLSLPSHLVIAWRGVAHRGDAKTMRNEEGGRTEEIDLPQAPNTMTYEFADFIEAVEAVRAGTSPDQAPAGVLGTIADARAITLASLAVADEVRRQTGVVFPADQRESEC